MATEFEVANHNLLAWADAQAQIGSGVPQDVIIPMMDVDGDIINKSVPNRGRFQEQVWDDVGGALGQFDRAIYVDSVNGNDNDSGSTSNPFKTIARALESVVNGSKTTIYLEPDMDYPIDEGFRAIIGKEISNSFLYIRSRDSSLANPRLIFYWGENDSGYVSISGFKIINSYLYFLNIDFNVPEYTGDSIKSLQSIIQYGSGGYSLCINNCNFDLHSEAYIAMLYIYAPIANISLSSVSITVDSSKSCIGLNGNSISLYSGSSVDIKDRNGNTLAITDVVDGVIRDANSGNPINIVSATNFSS